MKTALMEQEELLLMVYIMIIWEVQLVELQIQ